MRYLEEQKIGSNIGVAKVPIVPAAIPLTSNLGHAYSPGSAMDTGRQLRPPLTRLPGNAGVGMGASVGKFLVRGWG